MANCCIRIRILATTVCCMLATTAAAAGGSSSARLLNRRFSVREGEPNGTMVTQLSGRDLDVGQQRINIPVDATLRLLLPNDRLFTIRSGGQLVTASQLDREAICSSPDYNAYMDGDQCYVDVVVLVIAGDSAQRVRIPILIQDVNDNAPSWPEPSITVNVREETPNFQLRLPLAVDRDSAQYGVKRYRLTAGRELSLFEVTGSPREPVLRVLHKLDREKQASYNLTLEATDGSRAGHLDVLVTVTDVNDNAPAFQQSVYHFTVAEDTVVDMPIAQLTAIDADVGLNGLVTYSILLSAPEYCSSMFSVDASSGTLSVAAPLDYERTASCVFTVQATDQGEAERRSNVTIVNVTIVDVNDNVPQISVMRDSGEEKPLSVLENAPPGTIVGYVCPSDSDKNRHQRVDCQSLSPQFVLVLVDPCFQLRLASQLDREAHPTASAGVVVNCSDRGFDKSHEIIRNLTVLIEDVNDNTPHFSQQEYHFYVPEGELHQRALGRVVAFDPDAHKNAEIVFNITKNSYVVHPNNRQPAFRIAQDGDVFANTQFDRELNDTYVLEVAASDRGTPRLSSTAAVIVHVTDNVRKKRHVDGRLS